MPVCRSVIAVSLCLSPCTSALTVLVSPRPCRELCCQPPRRLPIRPRASVRCVGVSCPLPQEGIHWTRSGPSSSSSDVSEELDVSSDSSSGAEMGSRRRFGAGKRKYKRRVRNKDKSNLTVTNHLSSFRRAMPCPAPLHLPADVSAGAGGA